MLDLGQRKIFVGDLKKKLLSIHDALDIETNKIKMKDLSAQLEDENLWTDLSKAQELSQKLQKIKNINDKYESFKTKIEDLETLIDLCSEAGICEDKDEKEILDESIIIEKDLESFEIQTLLKGKYDSNNAILTLHAGAGGTEAQDWVSMLFRMYCRYAERNGYKINVLDKLDGDEAGIKSIIFSVNGENAYGYLKAEKGVHRLVRISPFDSNGRRHTSFASLEVIPEIIDDSEIVVRPEDLKVDTYRSSGAGGQHVNKTESAIRITHIPTGIIVQCQNERSQIQNRERAMTMLISKLAEIKERETLEREQSIRGEIKKIEWGSQIRSYVFCPYTMVKDHRTNYETGDVNAVMDGEIEEFIREYLKKS